MRIYGRLSYMFEVTNTNELYRAVLEMFNKYDPAKQIHLMQTLADIYLTETQFCQVIGRMRMYQAVSPARTEKAIPRLLITDSQINSVAKRILHDEVFGVTDNAISMWEFHNLLTGSKQNAVI